MRQLVLLLLVLLVGGPMVIQAEPPPPETPHLSDQLFIPDYYRELQKLTEELGALLGDAETPSPQILADLAWKCWFTDEHRSVVPTPCAVSGRYEDESRMKAFIQTLSFNRLQGKFIATRGVFVLNRTPGKGWTLGPDWRNQGQGRVTDPINLTGTFYGGPVAYPPPSDSELTTKLFGLLREMDGVHKGRVAPAWDHADPSQLASRLGSWRQFQGVQRQVSSLPTHVGSLRLPENHALLATMGEWEVDTTPEYRSTWVRTVDLSFFLFENRSGKWHLVDWHLSQLDVASELAQNFAARLCTVPVGVTTPPIGGAGRQLSLAEAGGMPLAQLIRRFLRMVGLNNRAEVGGYLAANLAGQVHQSSWWNQHLTPLASLEETQVVFSEDAKGNVTVQCQTITVTARHTKAHLLLVTAIDQVDTRSPRQESQQPAATSNDPLSLGLEQQLSQLRGPDGQRVREVIALARAAKKTESCTRVHVSMVDRERWWAEFRPVLLAVSEEEISVKAGVGPTTKKRYLIVSWPCNKAPGGVDWLEIRMP